MTVGRRPFARSGITLIELVVVMLLAAVPLAAVGMLLAGSSRIGQRIANDSQSSARLDGYAVMTSLQQFGRQSNLLKYTVYRITNSTFTVATPPSGKTIAAGQAVEFWYWNDKFNPQTSTADVLEISNTGTHYALYYLDGTQLKVDFGAVVNGVGGVKNNTRNTSNLIETQILASNVDIAKNINIFSHQIISGQGCGCVNTDLTLTDAKGVSVNIKFSTLIRSAWPR